MPQVIGVVGAGLVGCAAAIGFAKAGYSVVLFEGRKDIRKADLAQFQGRSINLALSDRGIKALKSLGQSLLDEVMAKSVPIKGRMIHAENGQLDAQEYSIDGRCINSIERGLLNVILLNHAQQAGVEMHFNHKLSRVMFGNGSDQPSELVFEDAPSYQVDVVIGADGAHSRVRYQMQRVVNMNYSQEYIDTHYLELYIPKQTGKEQTLDPSYLHLWPRSDFFLLAFANHDGSFTSTMFATRQQLQELKAGGDEAVSAFFRIHFPDALPLFDEGRLQSYFRTNPAGSLMSVKCTPYHFQGKALLIGDAAHSMVPFYGQGMNCGLEDVRVLLEILGQSRFDFGVGFQKYSDTRHKDLVAISDLSMRNHKELSHDVASLVYILRNTLDKTLTRVFGSHWLPLYTMVTFSPDLAYSEALRLDRRNDTIVRAGAALTVFAAISSTLWAYLRRN